MPDLPSIVTRHDPRTGVWEEFSFFSAGGADLFSVTHAPARGGTAGVVICPPIVVELLTNYRHEVLLARSLAASGIAVQRFHYRGAGHSSGDEAGATLETMIDDAVTAARHLVSRTGVRDLTFVGSRWGALVAAGAARESPMSPLALWEPAVDAARYFRELFRSRLVREMKDARFAGQGVDTVTKELVDRGWVDILGYKVHRALYDSARGITLPSMLARSTGPVLLVQFGSGAARPDYARLRDSGGERRIELQFIPEEAAWLFPGHRLKSAEVLIGRTSAWIRQSPALAGAPQ